MPENFFQRKSPRLRDYNYSEEGAYFVTICTQNRLHLFGDILNDEMVRNALGNIVHDWWLKVEQKYDDITLDDFVVMPNHLHGIVVINRYEASDHTSLSRVMQWFKTMTSNTYIRGANAGQWSWAGSTLWQRSFHDHIIRDERGLNALRQYVLSNPALWDKDSLR